MLVTRQPILRVQRTLEPVPRASLFPTPVTQVAVYKETLRSQFTKKQTQVTVYKETDSGCSLQRNRLHIAWWVMETQVPNTGIVEGQKMTELDRCKSKWLWPGPGHHKLWSDKTHQYGMYNTGGGHHQPSSPSTDITSVPRCRMHRIILPFHL